MAPSRGSGFDGQLFFVYDREAVTKEGDPPENAIIYFYPPSSSIESRVSICGQLVGVSNFLTTVLDFAPVLIKLKMEKVALCQSGKYTMALGGSSTEPESLLLRQLNALFRVFAFYHGSFDNVEKLSKDHLSFLSNMTIIWDCYLPFIRYYGDTLPAVFDPLPFLKTPKNSSGCFLKASHILQACQRRRHVLGGCILYKKSVLCTQLEPCITRRLLLLKPNQSHHPAKQVRTEINLPFGVRILHSFLTLCEYKRLIKELSSSPYHQNVAPQAMGSSELPDNGQDKERDEASGERFNGLLHKSVRKRIESESQETFHSRGLPRKIKLSKPGKQKARRISKERKSLLDKQESRSVLKHESSQKKPATNETCISVLHGNELRIDIPSQHQDDPENTDGTPEVRLEQDKHEPDLKTANDLPLGNENTETNDEENKNEESCSKTLPRYERKKNFLEEERLYLTASNDVESTENDYAYDHDSGSSDEEELTMDEVDVTDLRIVTYEDSDKEDKRDGAGKRSKISANEPQEALEDICNEVVNALVEQVVSGTTLSIAVCATHVTLPPCTTTTNPCEGQTINHHLDKPYEQETQPTSLDMDEPINEALEGNSSENIRDNLIDTPEGQPNGGLTLVAEENARDDFSNEENSEQGSDKVPGGATQAVSTISSVGCNAVELEQNGEQENNESIDISTTKEERKSIGTYNGMCESPEEQSIDGFPTGACVDSNDNGTHNGADEDLDDTSQNDCGSPGSEYHDSLDDLVADGAKSDEKFLQESNGDIFQDYKVLKKNDFTINKYSSKNINFPEEKNIEKLFFKDIIDGEIDKDKATDTDETDNALPRNSTPESSDLEANESNKDSRTSSELSGCPGECKSILVDSGNNPGLCPEAEADSNPSMPNDHHGDSTTNPSMPKDHHGDSTTNPSMPNDHHGDSTTNPSMPNDHHGDSTSLDHVAEPTDSLREGKVAKQTTENKDDDEEEEVDCEQEMDDNVFQVDGMVHHNLYVQAHSNTVLILLAESQLHKDPETIKALWKTSLNELGELEVRLNQCPENLDHPLKPEDYSYLVYDGLSNTTKGNLEEPVLKVDHMFCDTAKTVHEQFNNCSSLRSVTLRNSSSAVHCQRSLGQEVYFHKKGSFKSFLGSPSTRDPAFSLEKRSYKLLHKDHGVNVF